MANAFAYAKLLDRIMPMDRGTRYEDPLQDALAGQGLGEVTGGGTAQNNDGEILYVGIDMELSDLKAGVPLVCQVLEERGAAKGSQLLYSENGREQSAPFGAMEGLAIYLDGVNLPKDVYRDCDANGVLKGFEAALGKEGEVRGDWNGPKETALYLYGPSAARMRSLLANFMSTYPLCYGARVVEVTPTAEAPDWKCDHSLRF